MIPQSTIDEAIRRLVKAYNPLQMYLYGDYAWGSPHEESTYNILIVVESSDERAIKRGYLAFEALLGLRIPKNIVVFTKEEFDKYASDPTSTTHEIKTKGKIIYARGGGSGENFSLAEEFRASVVPASEPGSRLS